MSSDWQMITDQDAKTVMAYVAGDMTESERFDFEERLLRDADLAGVVRECLDLDSVLARNKEAFVRPGRPHAVLVMAALAAAVVALLGVQFLRGTSRLPGPRVALLEAYPSIQAYHAAHPRLGESLPPLLDGDRGETVREGDVSAELYWTRAEPIEAEAIGEALAAPVTDLESNFFVVPIELPSESAVVVVAVPATGDSQRLFPSPGAGSLQSQAALALLPEGRHVLPSARVQVAGSGDDARISLDRGFVVPRRAGQLTVLVGWRQDPLLPDELKNLDEALGATSTLELAVRLLSQLGFESLDLTVHEQEE